MKFKTGNGVLLMVLFIGAVILFNCTSCNSTKVDGWYYSADNKNDSIGKMIVSVKDFAHLQMQGIPDVEGNMVFQIDGRLKDSKRLDWVEATKKSINKHIYFIFEGKVIAAPMIEKKIDTGTFSISSFDLSKNGKEMQRIYRALKEEMSK